MDRLQTALQERDMTGSQLEIHFKSKMTDKEEEAARLKAEINILHEKLSQSSSQVSTYTCCPLIAICLYRIDPF